MMVSAEDNTQRLHDQLESASRAEREFIADLGDRELLRLEASKTEEALQATIDQLQGQLNEARSHGASATSAIEARLAAQAQALAAAQAEADQKARRATELEAEVGRLRAKSEIDKSESEESAKSAAREHDAEKAKSADLQAKLAALKKELEQSRAQEAQNLTLFALALFLIGCLVVSTLLLWRGVARRDQQLARLKVETDGQLGKAREEWENERRALKTKLKERERQLRAHRKIDAAAKDAKERERQRAHRMIDAAANDTKERERQRAHRKIDTLLAAQERQRAGFEAQIGAAANDAKERERQLQARLDEKAKEHNALKDAHVALTRDKEKFVEASKKNMTKIKAENAALKEQLAQLTRQMKEEKAQMLEEADGKAKRLNDVRAELTRDVEEFEARRAQTAQIAADAEKARTEVAAENAALEERLAQLTHQIEEFEARQAPTEDSGKRQHSGTNKLRQLRWACSRS
jgi:hypothetical protein